MPFLISDIPLSFRRSAKCRPALFFRCHVSFILSEQSHGNISGAVRQEKDADLWGKDEDLWAEFFCSARSAHSLRGPCQKVRLTECHCSAGSAGRRPVFRRLISAMEARVSIPAGQTFTQESAREQPEAKWLEYSFFSSFLRSAL